MGTGVKGVDGPARATAQHAAGQQHAAKAAPAVQPAYYLPVATYHPSASMTLGQALKPAEFKKIRAMTWINFVFSMLQLGMCAAIIGIVYQHLEGATYLTWPNGAAVVNYYCYFSNVNYYTPCRYAYALAGISMFWVFITCLITCLTLDCCGMGRVIEMFFDVVGTIWWVAGAITLTNYMTTATAAGVPGVSARQAVVALSYVSAFIYLCLAVMNGVLMVKYGKAYMAMAEQEMPVAQPVHVVQMAPAPAVHQPAAATAYPAPQAPEYEKGVTPAVDGTQGMKSKDVDPSRDQV